MAVMYPPKLPREVLEDQRRSSEVDVYNALKNQLDGGYQVFYSSPWLGTLPDGSEIDGEADFLITHADKGILAVEVKGGRVKLDDQGNWTSTDRHGFTRKVKNPVAQARSSKHNILGKLKGSHHWKPRYINARHGVILPHVTRPARDFRADMPLKIFAFDSDMDHLDMWVVGRFGDAGEDSGVEPLGGDGMFALRDMFSREINLHVRLGTSVSQDLKDIQLKTDDQIFILRELEDNPRMAIAGAAGTGKTILAIEKALMLAEEEKRVLLLCFNRPLGLHLQHTIGDHSHVTANYFHQFCREIATEAGKDADGLSSSELADQLIDNFIASGTREYDAVVIDEGQDFRDTWLSMLELVVSDGSKGVLYIFFDDNQRIASPGSKYIKALSLAKHNLTRNFRNTRRVFEEAEPYYRGKFVRCIGPEGIEAAYHLVENLSELKNKIAQRIGSLIKEEGVNPGDITVLVPDQAFITNFEDERGGRIGNYRVTNAEARTSDKPVLESIRRFKGLESPVVLLALDIQTAGNDELMYTAITRAQSLLEIFCSSRVNALLNERPI